MEKQHNTVKAIKDSIKHHKRMQKWVKTQNKEDLVDRLFMNASINEDWTGNFCPLCITFNNDCDKCPLAQKYGECDYTFFVEGSNAWQKIGFSENWGEWLRADKELIEQLESLLK